MAAGTNNPDYDVAVVGGGAAVLFAAIFAGDKPNRIRKVLGSDSPRD